MSIDLEFRPTSYYDSNDEVPAFQNGGPSSSTAPGFGGGRWLPRVDDDSVEIARVSLESTLGDDISIRARATEDGIEFTVADDYGTNYVVAQPLSQGPLSMRELIELIDTVHDVDNDTMGLTDAFRDMNYGGGDPGDLVDFVWVRSTFYPQLQAYYEGRAERWAAEKRLGHPTDNIDG